jgi:hypothetical protein
VEDSGSWLHRSPRTPFLASDRHVSYNAVAGNSNLIVRTSDDHVSRDDLTEFNRAQPLTVPLPVAVP